MDDAAISAYQLSQLCGIERTTIYRVSRGTRHGSEEFVEAVAPYLQLSKNEKQALLDTLKIEKIGKDVYHNRVEIRKLFSEIDNWQRQIKKQSTEFFTLQNIQIGTENENPVIALHNEHELELCIISMLQTISDVDNVEVYSNSLKKAPLIQSTLLQIGNITKKYVSFYQHIQFEKTVPEKVVSSNMKVINKLLPFAITYPGKYEVYYTYATANQAGTSLFPYCVVVDKYVLYMAEDYQRGVLVSLPEFAKSVKEEIERIRKQYTCLLNRKLLSNGEKSIFCKQEKMDFFYAGNPAAVLFANKKFIDEFVVPEYRDVFGYFCEEYEKNGRQVQQFFSDQRLKSILENPRQLEQMDCFLLISDDRCRKQMAQNIYHKLSHENQSIHILKETSIPTIPDLKIGLKRHRWLTIVNQTVQDIKWSINITEQSICSAFEDFFESLDQLDVLLNKEEEDKIFAEWL